MASNRNRMAAAVAAMIIVVCASALLWQSNATAQSSQSQPKTVVFSFTSGSDSIVQVETGFHVAEDALNAGRRVILFFNGRGVTIPIKRLSPDLRLTAPGANDERPLWLILRDLIDGGAEVIVARDAAKILNMDDREFIAEAQIGVNVFHKMPPDAVVFTY